MSEFLQERGDNGACGVQRPPMGRYPFFSTTLAKTVPEGETSAELELEANRDLLFNDLTVGVQGDGLDTLEHVSQEADNSAGVVVGAGLTATVVTITGLSEFAEQTYREYIHGHLVLSAVAGTVITVEVERSSDGGTLWTLVDSMTIGADGALESVPFDAVSDATPAADVDVQFRVRVTAGANDVTVNGESLGIVNLYRQVRVEYEKTLKFSVEYCDTTIFRDVSSRPYSPCCARKPRFLMGVRENKTLKFSAKLDEPAPEGGRLVLFTVYGLQGNGCCD